MPKLVNLFRDLKSRHSASCLILLAALFAYVLTQVFFKWFPFPPGRTAIKLPTLQDNMVSVLSSLALFAVVIFTVGGFAIVRNNRMKIPWTPRPVDWLLGAFVVFLILQVGLRESKGEELLRSLALGGSLLSSVLLAKYFTASPERRTLLLNSLKWFFLTGVALGFAVAVIHPPSADWGGFAGAECLGTMLCRTEFFFFAINPLFLVVLLWRNSSPSRRNRLIQIAVGCFIFALALTTRTRQLTLTMTAAAMLIFFLWAKDRKKILYSVGGLALLVAVFAGPQLLRLFLEYTRVVVEPSAIAVDARAADWTSGRRYLLELLWKMFLDAPLFGLGGVEVRALIQQAQLIARTEHGFVFYLAAYGVFGLLFFAYIASAFFTGVKNLWQAMRGHLDVGSDEVTLALIAVPLFPFGFVGLFGSATNPTDWLALCLAALVLQSSRGNDPQGSS